MEVKQDRMMMWYVLTKQGRVYYPTKLEAEQAVQRVTAVMNEQSEKAAQLLVESFYKQS